jgi:class 3 adenylate cyclase
MPELPSGTVTFVFSDLEGSTRLLKQLGDEKFAGLLATHRALVRESFARHDGNEIDTQGDAFFYSFARARAAVAAAVEVQRAHVEQTWPDGVKVNVRLGLHTGEPVVGDEGYTGLDVVRAARIAADGKGGQILLSEATRAIVGGNLPEGVGIRELGERTLKDIDRPEPLFELVYVTDSAAPEPAQAQTSVIPAPPEAAPVPHEVSFDVKPAGLLKGWRDIAKVAIDAARHDDDPGRVIEERVMAQLKESFGEGIIRTDTTPKVKPPKPPGPKELPEWSEYPSKKGKKEKPGKSGKSGESVADGLSRLNELRESGALTDEQYQKAVDRLLAEG